jgi:hypothetical protein
MIKTIIFIITPSILVQFGCSRTLFEAVLVPAGTLTNEPYRFQKPVLFPTTISQRKEEKFL